MKKIIIGMLILLAIGWCALFLLPRLGPHDRRMQRDESKLAQIGKAVNMWLLSHGRNEYYPPTLRSLWDDGIIKEGDVFQSRALRVTTAPMYTTDFESIVDMCARQVSETEGSGAIPFAWTRRRTYDGDIENMRVVVYFDSHTEQMTEEEFGRLWTDIILPFVEAHNNRRLLEKLQRDR